MKKDAVAKLLPLIIIAAGFILYANSLQGKFMWDDEALVRTNAYTRSFANMPKIFTSDIGDGSGNRLGFYRPIQILTYTIDYLFYGMKEWGYRLTNIFLHALVALSIYWMSNILYGKRWASFLAAMLFLAHPINTATVSYISGRADALANLFLLLGFIFYVMDTRSPSFVKWIAIIIAYTLALLSKESSIIFPVLLLLYHYSFIKKIDARRFASVMVITLCYILIRFTVLKDLLVPPSETIGGSTTVIERIPGFFASVVDYAQAFILPIDIHMGRPMYLFRPSEPRVILGFLIFAALVAAAFGFRKTNSRNLVFFGIMWPVAAILPVSNIYPLNTYMAEHWLALPSVGIFLMIGNCVIKRDDAYPRFASPFFALLASAALLFYGYITIWQNSYWTNPKEFYRRVLKYEPDNVNALIELARQYETTKPEEAIKLYTKAVELNPKFAIPYNNLGLIYNNMGKLGLAIKYYEKAVELNPKFSIAINNLAGAYKLQGRTAEAIKMYNKAIKVNPNFAGAYSNLGFVYAAAGRYDEAMAAFEKAIQIRPDLPQAYYNLAAVYYNLCKYGLAVEYYDKAVSLGWKTDTRFKSEIESVRDR